MGNGNGGEDKRGRENCGFRKVLGLEGSRTMAAYPLPSKNIGFLTNIYYQFN